MAAAAGLAARDGYYLNDAVRISLPPQASVITENLSYLPGGEVLVEDVELDTYLAERALDGLFLKLAEQEQKIRHDPVARVTDLLRRVFGENQTEGG